MRDGCHGRDLRPLVRSPYEWTYSDTTADGRRTHVTWPASGTLLITDGVASRFGR